MHCKILKLLCVAFREQNYYSYYVDLFLLLPIHQVWKHDPSQRQNCISIIKTLKCCLAILFRCNHSAGNAGGWSLDASYKRSNLYQCQVYSNYKWCFREPVLCLWLVMKEAVCFFFLRLFVPVNLHRSEEDWNPQVFVSDNQEAEGMKENSICTE